MNLTRPVSEESVAGFGSWNSFFPVVEAVSFGTIPDCETSVSLQPWEQLFALLYCHAVGLEGNRCRSTVKDRILCILCDPGKLDFNRSWRGR
jgi:hypothetical protein